MPDSVQRLLRHMEKVHEIHQQPSQATITAEEFEGKIRVWTESTTTSPSGLHLGHFKALIARHSFSTEATDDELTDKDREQRDEVNFKQRELFNLASRDDQLCAPTRVFVQTMAHGGKHNLI